MLAPLRRRALEVSLLLAEPGSDDPDSACDRAGAARRRCECSPSGPVVSPSTISSGSTRHRPVSCRSRFAACGTSVSACLRPRDGSRDAVPFELDRAFAEDRLDAALARSSELGALHHLLRERVGLDLTRPELAGFRRRRRQPVLRARARPRAGPTGSRPTAGRALRVPDEPARAARRPPGAAPGRDGRRRPLRRRARPPDGRARGERARDRGRLDALDTAAREGVVELDDSRLRFAHPLLASICYEQAPIWKRRAIHGALAGASSTSRSGRATWRCQSRAPTPSPPPSSTRPSEQAAARGATAAAAELCELAAELTPDDLGLAAANGACGQRSSTASPATASGRRDARADPHRGSGGIERSDMLVALASTFRAVPPRRSSAWTRHSRMPRGRRRDGADSGATEQGSISSNADIGAALVDSVRGSKRPSGSETPPCSPLAIARVATAEVVAGEITPGHARAGCGDRGAPGSCSQYYESPSYTPQPAVDRAWARSIGPRVILAEHRDEGGGARRRGQPCDGCSGPLGMLEWFAGNWQRASSIAVAAHELTEQTQHSHGRVWVATRQGPGRGRPRPRRAGASVGRGAACAFAEADVERVLRHLRARPARPARACARRSRRRQRAASASCPERLLARG